MTGGCFTSCSIRTEILLKIQEEKDRVAGAADSVETPRLPSPQTPPPAPLGEPKAFPRQPRDIVPPVCPGPCPGPPPGRTYLEHLLGEAFQNIPEPMLQ
ncbi:hypothetical protein ILYODFUR_027097 [Ilyodon furcidens]|uniref:Uncharacterized protein n=1 Tax=Ilyodon furcidens TaxID=33524 RepID=A0ABV0VIG6_9TELE